MKFKVGDRVTSKDSPHKNMPATIIEMWRTSYNETMCSIKFDELNSSQNWNTLEKNLKHIEEQKQTGGIKHDADKVDFALVPVHPHTEVARVWTFGKKKYDAWNWKKGFIWSRPYAAALRHIYSWARGESNDPETGMPHLAHAICCLMMLIEFEHKGIGEDDRQKDGPNIFDSTIEEYEQSTFRPKPTPGQFLKRTSNKGNDNE